MKKRRYSSEIDTMNTPKYAVMEYNQDGDFWTVNLVRDSYDEAMSEKARLEGKGCEGLYLVNLNFMFGPRNVYPSI